MPIRKVVHYIQIYSYAKFRNFCSLGSTNFIFRKLDSVWILENLWDIWKAILAGPIQQYSPTSILARGPSPQGQKQTTPPRSAVPADSWCTRTSPRHPLFLTATVFCAASPPHISWSKVHSPLLAKPLESLCALSLAAASASSRRFAIGSTRTPQDTVECHLCLPGHAATSSRAAIHRQDFPSSVCHNLLLLPRWHVRHRTPPVIPRPADTSLSMPSMQRASMNPLTASLATALPIQPLVPPITEPLGAGKLNDPSTDAVDHKSTASSLFLTGWMSLPWRTTPSEPLFSLTPQAISPPRLDAPSHLPHQPRASGSPDLTGCWCFLCSSASAQNCQCSTSLGVFSSYHIYIFPREEGSLSCLRLT
jgi:hypothetical protein